VAELSRNAQLLKYFAQQYPGIPRKRLVKLAYMTDILGRQYLGKPLSGMNWILYHHGPYSQEIPEAINELEVQDLCWTEVINAPTGEATWKKLYDAGKPVLFDFSLAEDQVLGFVIRTYRDMPMDELMLDVVYETTPYKQAEKFGDNLQMNLVDDEGKREFGFDLEAIARAERQAEEGDFVTAREYFDGLRDRITARYAERD